MAVFWGVNKNSAQKQVSVRSASKWPKIASEKHPESVGWRPLAAQLSAIREWAAPRESRDTV